MKVISTVLAVAALACGCGPQPQEKPSVQINTPAPAPGLAVMPLALPVAAGASLPQLTASTRGAILSWVEQNGAMAALRFAQRTGNEWSEPRTVTSGSDWFLSEADVPTVQRL